jgi:hypothetical protein
MTLVVHVWGSIWRSRVSRVLDVVVTILLKLLNTTRWSLVLAWNLRTRLVADGRKLDIAGALLVTRRWSAVWRALAISRNCSRSGSLILSFALVLFFLLSCLPLLSDLFEFCRGYALAQ